MGVPLPDDIMGQQAAQIAELIGGRLSSAIQSAFFQLSSAVALLNRPRLIGDIGASMDYDVANPDLSGGGIVAVYPPDPQRWSLFAFPRGTGAVNLFLGFEMNPRTLIEIMPGRPHKLLFADAGPAMQQSVRAQSPGGASGVSLWSVKILRQ